MKYCIANWKAFKNIQEVDEWIALFLNRLEKDGEVQRKLTEKKIHIILCPPFPLLVPVREAIRRYKTISLGAQDISLFQEGSYTGEVTGKALQHIVQYALVGHSERKKYFHESLETIQAKTRQALLYGITPIVCFENIGEVFPHHGQFFAYEPPSAIGTGLNETVENVEAVRKSLPLKKPITFLYGGSVTEKTITEYLQSDLIDGFLIGSASLDPMHFFNIAKQC